MNNEETRLPYIVPNFAEGGTSMAFLTSDISFQTNVGVLQLTPLSKIFWSFMCIF